jgi:hypothetical protein
MFLVRSNPTMTGIRIRGGIASSQGGGMALSYASPRITDLSIRDCTADEGGGLADESGCGVFNRVELLDNEAENGGGIYAFQSCFTLTQATIAGNIAGRSGGGIYLDEAHPTLSQTSIVGNGASSYGGGVYMDFNNPILLNSVVAYNVGSYNLYRATNGTLSVRYSAIYDPQSDNVYGVTLDSTNKTGVPGYLEAPSLDGSTGLWVVPDQHLALTSPLINAGDPSLYDADGSRADIGIYGGAGGNAWDRDGDGYPDYYWPGTLTDAPSGVNVDDFDIDDLDGSVW